MTAKQFINNTQESGYLQGYSIDLYYYTEEDIESMLKEYSQIKCKELLETVAEEGSKISATIYIKPNTPHYARLNKNSILNCVDLDSFIS